MIDNNQMRDATCIVGVGNSAYGNFPETDAYGLGVEALTKALDDAGLTLADIDGLDRGPYSFVRAILGDDRPEEPAVRACNSSHRVGCRRYPS